MSLVLLRSCLLLEDAEEGGGGSEGAGEERTLGNEGDNVGLSAMVLRHTNLRRPNAWPKLSHIITTPNLANEIEKIEMLEFKAQIWLYVKCELMPITQKLCVLA